MFPLCMEIFGKNENLSEILAENFKTLRNHAGLTIEGIANALSISISYVLMIERAKANISTKLAKKIGDFFDVDVAQLYRKKHIISKNTTKTNSVSKFYQENKENAKFFIERRSDYSTANFIKNVLLKDTFMHSFHTIGQIREYSKKEYSRELDSQELSREIRRLYEKDIISRKDKFGNGSVFFYQLKINDN